MSIKTYGPHHPIVPLETGKYDGPLKPGDFVTHADYGGTGMVIAVTTEELCVLWSIDPRDWSFGGLPPVQRVFPRLRASQLVSIQPMSVPSGSVFYLDYTYGDKENKRCNTGPWLRKMTWRSVKWMRSALPRCGSFLSSLLSLFSSSSERSGRVGQPKQLSASTSKIPAIDPEVISSVIKEYDKKCGRLRPR